MLLIVDGFCIGGTEGQNHFYTKILTKDIYQQMVMIWHQTICQYLCIWGSKILERFKKEIVPILFFKENRFSVNTAIINMIDLVWLNLWFLHGTY